MVCDPSIKHRDPKAVGPNCNIPGSWQVDSIRLKVMPLIPKMWIIRHKRREHQVIRLGIFNIGQGHEPTCNAFYNLDRKLLRQLQHMRAV